MINTILKIIFSFFGIYILILGLLYLFQERLLFFPEKLNKKYEFRFAQAYEEVNIKTKDDVLLNGLLFKAEQPKGVIFYLHGNAGSLASWGDVASTYTDLGYDVFLLDYRGFGKSEGRMNNQIQAFEDVQLVYNYLKKSYLEEKIMVLGYSLGTGLATKIASSNNPRMLILQAPYYSLVDVMQQRYPFIPEFVLKYPFLTNEHIQNCQMPIMIFHGDQDQVIYHGSSEKLKAHLKPIDQVIFLQGQGHNGMTDNLDYRREIAKLLK